jgi:hypothetical protein
LANQGWIMLDNWMIEDVYDAARKGKAAIDRANQQNLTSR